VFELRPRRPDQLIAVHQKMLDFGVVYPYTVNCAVQQIEWIRDRDGRAGWGWPPPGRSETCFCIMPIRTRAGSSQDQRERI